MRSSHGGPVSTLAPAKVKGYGKLAGRIDYRPFRETHQAAAGDNLDRHEPVVAGNAGI